MSDRNRAEALDGGPRSGHGAVAGSLREPAASFRFGLPARALRFALAVGFLLSWCALAASPGFATQWRAASLYGGDVQAITIDPRDPDYILAGTSSGQIFVSSDGGEGWTSGDGALFPGWVVVKLLFDPNSSQRVWVALRGMSLASGLVAVSEDRGLSWVERSGGLPGRQIYSLAAVPGVPGTLYAGTRDGVFVTEDNGHDWRHLSASRPEIKKVTSLLVDPERPETIYAGTWRRAYRSDDAGVTWKELANGMQLDREVFTLLEDPGGQDELWASTCGGIYRGVGRGESWTFRSRGLPVPRTPSLQSMAWGRLLAGTVEGVYFSDNRGSSWRRVPGEPLVTLALAHHPDRPGTVFAGTEGTGVWRSLNGGSSFAPASRGLSALRIAGVARVGDEVLAAVRHARGAAGIYSSFDGGLSFDPDPVRLPPILDLASDGERVLAGTERGLFERIDGDWQRLDALGDRRVSKVVVSLERVLVRSDAGVFEVRGRQGHPIDLGEITPQDMALIGGTVWMVDRDGSVLPLATASDASYRPVTDDALDVILATLREPGTEGATRDRAGTPRLHATGDRNWPFLVVRADGSAVLAGSSGDRQLPIELAVEPQYLSGALVHRGRLLLATSGYGILVSTALWPDTEQTEAAPAEPMVSGSRFSAPRR